MHPAGGLHRFQDDVNPVALGEIASWPVSQPGLRRLVSHLEATAGRNAFLDRFAEAMVARHLVSRGCALRAEVPTPAGKTADLEVAPAGGGDPPFFLHVKRLNTDRPFRRRLTVSSRLRSLERILRPYVVSIHLRDEVSDQQVRRFVASATQFIRHARVGDELMVHDEHTGAEIGGCRIVAPCEGGHVNLAIGLPTGFIDESPRMQKLMRRAYRQFMPRGLNVILIGSSHPRDADDFESALLGSHVERWDAFPPQGRRIASGRAADGFWSGRQFADSLAAGWFLFNPRAEGLQSRLWIREGAGAADTAIQRLRGLLDSPGDGSVPAT
jgi:hypothetical protein